MNTPKSLAALTLATLLFICQPLFAHNGKIGHAHPLGRIAVDGNLSDWPASATKYPINIHISPTKPLNDEDFSGFFQTGYRADNHSLYFAFTITDNDFIEDTSAGVSFDSQDGLEFYLDGRHLPMQSGVASFMYSKKLRNTNNAFYDPFAKSTNWDNMEVVMVRKGNVRYYEWRVDLRDQFAVGKSIGIDVTIFDKDKDGSFSFSAWGDGGYKFMIPGNLGDIILVPANTKTATITGTMSWDKKPDAKFPNRIRLTSVNNSALWVETRVDSLGNYSADVLPGDYRIGLSYPYVWSGKNIYTSAHKSPVQVTAVANKQTPAPVFVMSGTPAPDLLPVKGILHDFNSASALQVDNFIETYRQYYGIPGVSLALIRDGKVVYHKTYGELNSMTGKKVADTTLFEAASVTKPVFAFAVQRLAERGVIDLDKPLYLYHPYKDIEHDERYKLITARHVLTHRTGFPNWRSMNEDGKLNIRFTPGTDYNYSGEGFEYLKWVVEKITGKKIEQVLQEEIIEPIGLYHTFFSRNDSLRRMVANGHFDMLPTHDDLPSYAGMAWSMHTEAKIFTRFMLYMLEQKGLSAESYNVMFSKHSEFKNTPDDKIPAYMGMSLEIRETPFGKSFGHGGNNGDFKCGFEVYKDAKMGYVIFTNSNTSDALIENLRKFLVEGK